MTGQSFLTKFIQKVNKIFSEMKIKKKKDGKEKRENLCTIVKGLAGGGNWNRDHVKLVTFPCCIVTGTHGWTATMGNQAAEKALAMHPDCSVIETLRQGRRQTSTVCEGPRHLAVWNGVLVFWLQWGGSADLYWQAPQDGGDGPQTSLWTPEGTAALEENDSASHVRKEMGSHQEKHRYLCFTLTFTPSDETLPRMLWASRLKFSEAW